MGAKKWILIVDDEPEVRESLRELINLSFSGNTKMVESKDGVEATAKLTQQAFDCIITDLKMPRKDGKALIASIRQNHFNNRTPVIILSGQPDPRIEEDYSFIYSLEKPFQHNVLTDLLSTQLKIGKQGGRIAADILNNLIGAIGSFLEQVFEGSNYEIESPRAKLKSESLDCEYVSKIEFTVNDAKHTFGILCTKQMLSQIAKSTKHDATDYNVISAAMGHSTLKYVLKTVSLLEFKKINIQSFELSTNKNFMRRRSGILIPLKIADSTLEIIASVAEKTV